jgi:hypothetical protein
MLQLFINSISENQLRKLERGQPIQLKYDQFKLQTPADSIGYIKIHPVTHKKVVNAHTKKKGVRIGLTEPELNESGEGLKSMWGWIKNKAAPAVVKAAKFVKKNVIDSDLYQKDIKPIVRSGVDSLESMIPDNVIGKLAKSGIESVGSKTGGYGIKAPKKPRAKKSIKTAASAEGLYATGLYA